MNVRSPVELFVVHTLATELARCELHIHGRLPRLQVCEQLVVCAAIGGSHTWVAVNAHWEVSSIERDSMNTDFRGCPHCRSIVHWELVITLF